jgi:hypothetical protein
MEEEFSELVLLLSLLLLLRSDRREVRLRFKKFGIVEEGDFGLGLSCYAPPSGADG